MLTLCALVHTYCVVPLLTWRPLSCAPHLRPCPGVCALVAVHPLEAIRTRQALGLRGNFVQAMADVARTEGVPALYKARARWQHCCAASLLDCRPSAMQICAVHLV